MGQAEIIKILEKHGELSTKEIQEKSGVGKSAVNVALKKLAERGEIHKRKLKIKMWIVENFYKIKEEKKELKEEK